MSLASIQIINNIIPHNNADTLEIAQIGSWQAIIKKNQFKIGQKICFIETDTLLPKDSEWAKFYLSKSSRVRTIKLRGQYSQGIVESLSTVGLPEDLEIGTEVSEIIGVIKYETAITQCLESKGRLPFGIFKTDENNYKSLSFHEPLPFGELVTVTEKCDGSSFSTYCKFYENNWITGITSRSMDLKLDVVSPWTEINNKLNILDKIKKYCVKNNVSLCFRGELLGNGLNRSKPNPYSSLPLDIKFFSLLNLSTLQYESFNTFEKICTEICLPIVPILERDVILTKELIEKYEEMEKLNEKYFEGIVINYIGKDGFRKSFKVINKNYDSLK